MVKAKTRFLVLKINYHNKKPKFDANIKLDNFVNFIRDSVYEDFGILGLGTSGLVGKYYNQVTDILIIRCSRSENQNVKTTITSITHFELEPIYITILKISGLFSCCKEYISKYNIKFLNENKKLTSKEKSHMKEKEAELNSILN